MLTASLQSTWDTQRNRQGRSKYLQSTAYGGDFENEKNGNHLRVYGNNRDLSGSGSTDLPNLRIPSINRNSLGGTTNFGASPNAQSSQLSPRGDRRNDQSMAMTKKQLRAVSRQAGAGHAGGGAGAGSNGRTGKKGPHRNDAEEGSMFPQLPAVGQSLQQQQLQLQSTSLQQPSHFLNITKKNAAYAHVGSLNTMPMTVHSQHLGPGSQNAASSVANSNSSSLGAENRLHSTPHHAVSNGNITIEEHSLCAVTSIKGLKPSNPNWINQDNFFVMENSDVRIYGVLDGHGENGHHVSRRCRENFPHFIKSANGKMDLAFNMMHNDLNSSDFDVRCSGATGVVATINSHGRLCVFNCGDSRAVMGRRTPNGAIIAQQMSNDHKPDKPEERKRILSCGGHLGCRQVLVNQGNRGPVSMPVGPCRVWYQHRGETLGLAMSRSLGDAIVHKFGVTAEPELIEHPIDELDEFLILATDGVWDVVDNNHAVQMVHNFAVRSQNWSPLEAANCVVKFARSRWEKLSPMVDDITCIIIKLQPISISGASASS
jgi:serine/threonine protein phosphatase PrpC